MGGRRFCPQHGKRRLPPIFPVDHFYSVPKRSNGPSAVLAAHPFIRRRTPLAERPIANRPGAPYIILAT